MITRYIFGLVTGGDRSARSRFGTSSGGRTRLQRGLVSAVLAAAAACAPDAGGAGSADSGAGVTVEPRADYAEVAAALSSMVEREREQKGLEAFSIALVDRDDVVWADGFGAQDPERGIPASAETVYRVGSVSKLFTDIAVMQLVERGELDLDVPVRDYVPDFAPENPTGTGITLRQLMSHRSGLIREPPAGHYFDDTGTDLAATVASLNGTPQIYPPTARTKYSNAGIAVVGYTLEVTRGEPFADYVRRAVLEPLAMTSSAFTPEPEVVDDLARAYMWGFDRGLFDAPTFELGMSPAGSMYSTVLDLSRFMSALFRGGEGENGRILQPETLESMWAPQFAPEGATSGYGLGFAVQERAGQRRLGHGGAIYGFSTQLAFLPESGIGVVAVSAVDGTNTVTGRVADAALELMLAAKAGGPLPEAPLLGTDPIEWFFLYPLEEVSRDVFAFPDRGLYHGERLAFTRDAEGRAIAVEAASVRFARREVGTEAGGTFRIDPVRPVEDLRAEAQAASPPTETGSFRESELVEVTSLEPGIRLDVRYATTNNFMSSVFYDEPRVFLQRPAAEAVARAHRALAEDGYGLLLHDGYRPWYVTKMFWDATPESDKIFVADPASGSRHNRGSAIDLNLFDLATGEPVDMVGTYDEFSPRSFPNYPGGTSRQRWLRELLRRTMEAEGFTVYEAEWWHFDHEDWRSYAIQNATFEELRR
ncbi:serine hydrolase [Candidatus Palauibacter sp.]|uniref:serine hydrolase n=1 Tax=Candidatus Palauibacter sp. TaxID=3101350 RepID=UPI003B521743